MEAEREEEAAEEKLEAGRNACRRCKERSCLRNIEVPGEATGADGEAAASSPGDGAEIIQRGGYSDQRIISLDKAAFYQKKMPPRTFLATQKSMPGFEASKDRLSLLLGVHAAGDFRGNANLPFCKS